MKKGWSLVKISNLFDIQSSKRVHKKDWKASGVPFYRAREVVKLARDGYVENELFISEDLYNEYTKDKGAPKKDDIIISAVGTLGKCYLVKENDKFYIKDASVLWFSKKGQVLSEFIEYSFKAPSIIGQVLDSSMGATVGTLTITRAKKIKIPLPPLDEQQAIVAKLDNAFKAIDQAKANLERNLANAEELFQSQLNQIFSQTGKGWEEKKLGEIGKVSMCKRILKKQTSPKGDIPFYKIGTFGKKPNAFISKEIYNEFKSKYSFPKKGDILISASGTIGRRVVYDGEPAYFQDSNIVWIDNNEESVSNQYLYFFYGYCDWKPSKGATISRLYNNDLRRIKISFPSLETQVKLIKKIKKLDQKSKSLKTKYQQKLDSLEELRQSILEKAFQGELV